MAKFTLDTDDFDEPDFLLIGISSHAKSYRLCWSLNQVMDLHLTKADFNIEITNTRKKTQSVFEVYDFEDENLRIHYFLISNKNRDGYLLPELKHVDYFMMLKENLNIDLNSVIEQVKKSDQVLTAFTIAHDDIKSKENLLF